MAGIHATRRCGSVHAGYLEAIWVTPLALIGEASIAVSIAGVTSDRDDTWPWLKRTTRVPFAAPSSALKLR
jgi:hypothetical protein